LTTTVEMRVPSAPETRSRWAILIVLMVAGVLVVVAWVGSSRRPSQPPTDESSPIDSLAVLPLAAYLAEDRQLLDTALTDMLIGDIARVCAVDVAPGIALSRESGSWSLEEALDALGVDAVVEGAVARSGDNLWISLQLVDLRSGRMLWNATYDRQLGDELLVLREVTQDAALRIRDELAQHPVWQELPDPISVPAPSFDVEALQAPEKQDSRPLPQDSPE
ncbi:MAG: hypothetical protein K8J08_02340, partial [Thermoanaerobaculia bacterium]|nr:hypothetical protein [Thermoanaerobaculia bacterium]